MNQHANLDVQRRELREASTLSSVLAMLGHCSPGPQPLHHIIPYAACLTYIFHPYIIIEKCVYTCTCPIDLHPDVNLKRTGIEIDDNNSSQCRVQFNVSVSDSIHMYTDTCIYITSPCACIYMYITFLITSICVCGVYMYIMICTKRARIIHTFWHIPILGQMFYRYGENVLVRIIACNSKKMVRDK